MSEDVLLARHPAPHSTESLFGYILRLSDENGYCNPRRLFLLAGMKGSRTWTTGMRVEKLASIANRRTEELEEIAYYDANSVQRCRLLRHAILLRHLRLSKPAICPQCLQERGFIEAHWDLHVMTGCPIHRRALLSACPQCKQPLGQFRRGMLECSCGAYLEGVDLPPISTEDAALLDVIRRKVLRLPTGPEDLVKLPMEHLAQMDLHPLLGLIHVLGRHYRNMHLASNRNCPDSDLGCAANVLTDWPDRFFAFLTQLFEDKNASSAGLARGALRHLYQDLFKLYVIPDRSQVEFVKRACVEFLANHWGGGVADPKLLKSSGINGAERYINVAALARRLRIHRKTAEGFLKNGTIAHHEVMAASLERILIDSRAITVNPLLPGRMLREREAAYAIGIPMTLLRSLRASGDYEVRSAPKSMGGFHEIDVKSFIAKIKDLVDPLDVQDTAPLSTLRQAFHELDFSVNTQLCIVQKLFAKDIHVYGNGDTPVADLLVRRDAIRIVVDKCVPWYSETHTRRDAAKLLNCSVECIVPLVKHEFLREIETPTGLRVANSSVRKFIEQFIPLSMVATMNNTSSRALMKCCEKHGIFMLIVRVRVKKLVFVRAKEVRRIVDLRGHDKKRRTMNARNGVEVPTETTAMEHSVETQFLHAPEAPQFVEYRLPSAAGTISWLQTGKLLKCHVSCIPLLLKQGLLSKKQTRMGCRITEQSVHEFALKFISLQELSQARRSTSRSLRRCCEGCGISVLTLQGYLSRRSFIRREDVDSLMRALPVPMFKGNLSPMTAGLR